MMNALGIPGTEAPRKPRARGGGAACTATVVGTLDFGTWRIDGLNLRTPQGEEVIAWLYYPVRSDPVPAVITLAGHFSRGHANEGVQERCRDLVRRGFVTLALHDHRAHSNAFEYFAADSSLLGWQLADVRCAMDYLQARPEVRAADIGITGESGGGMLAGYAAATDDRLRAAALVSALTSAEGDLVQGECGCNYVPGQLLFADLPDVYGLHAPKPLLATIGLDDRFLTPASARAAASRVRAIYAAAGAPSALEIVETAGGHGYDAEARILAGEFFERVLGPVTPTGEVAEEAFASDALPFPSVDRSHAEITATSSRGIARAQRLLRPRVYHGPAWVRGGLWRSLGLEKPLGARLARGAVSSADDVHHQDLELEVEPGLHLRGLVVFPAQGRARGTWLWLSPRGATGARWEAEELARRGYAVVTGSLRGQGHHWEPLEDRTLLYMSQAAGKPLLGQRLLDAAAWLLVARSIDSHGQVVVLGEGESGDLAVALGVATEVAGVVTLGAPITLFAEETDDPRWGLPPSLAVPRLARVGDLSHWVRACDAPVLWIAPRLRSGAEATPADEAWGGMAALRDVGVEPLPSDFWARLKAFEAAATR